MISHLVALCLFSGLVSVVFAFLQREDPKARVVFGLKIFAGFLAATVLVGWLMFPFPG
jgi:hypothetical protein